MESPENFQQKRKTKWLFIKLCISILFLSQSTFGQRQPVSPSTSHSLNHCSRATHDNNSAIPNAKVIDDKKAACKYKYTDDWANLSQSALISALREVEDYDCYRDMFQESADSERLFTNNKVQAVTNEIKRLSSSYNGTNSTGMFGLTIYMHVAVYLDFNSTNIELTSETYKQIRESYGQLATNSNLLQVNPYALDVLREYLITAGAQKTRYNTNIINFTEDVLRDLVDNKPWKSISDPELLKKYFGTVNTIYNGIWEVLDSNYENALEEDSQTINLLGKVAVDNELTNIAEHSYVWKNAVGGLTRFATSERLIDKVEPHLAAIINNSERLSPNWAQAMGALNQYGDCNTYNLCEHPDAIRKEVEDYLFPKTVSYDDGKMIIRTPLSGEKIQNLYHAAKQVQNQFFRAIQTDEPVTGDINETINMIVFGSLQQYEDYAPFLYGIATNNGGMYIESRATFYTWDRTVGVESSLSLESLFRHEYTHYLQGRYLVPGYWGASEIYENSRLVWYEEGMADFFAGSTDTEGVKFLAQNARKIKNEGTSLPSLSIVFNSSYSSGNFYHYTYGNAAWYNWYLNDFQYLKRFFDYTRNNDINGFDTLVENLRSSGETSFKSFLEKVQNQEIIGWQPETFWLDDNLINISTTSDIQSEIGNIPNTSNISVSIDAEKYYRRFKIEGQISGTVQTGTNQEAAKEISKQLNNVLLKLRENERTNNFEYTVGYFKNLNSGGTPTANFVISGPLRDSEISGNPIVGFSSGNPEIVAGRSVKFKSESSGYIKRLDWSFPSGSPSTVTDKKEPEITYNTEGTYNVSLKVDGNSGTSDTETKENYVRVYAANTNTYCDVVNEGGSDVYIRRVKLSDLDNTSGYTTSYVDNTSVIAILRTNESSELKINTRNEHWNRNALGVWIDWNQDGDFDDANEEVMHKYGAGPYEKQLAPPSGALLGTTRMRVRISYGDENKIKSCGFVTGEGEIEDYSIVVTTSQSTNNIAPTLTILKPSNGQNFVQKENISVETQISDDGKIDRVELSVDGGMWSVDKVAPYQWSNLNKLNFLNPGQHELKVTVYDEEGLSESKTVTVNIERAPITYCEASTQQTDMYIKKVVFGNINNTSTSNPYSDFTNKSTTVQKGEQVSLTINTTNESWPYNAIGVWIDWNHDGDFIDNGEQVYSLYAAGPYNSTITVPSSAVEGEPIRMRLRMGYGDKNKITPCGVDSHSGEVEDYTIYVGNGSNPTCTDGIQNGDEIGVDCGGSSCSPCSDTPTCSDGIQNGDETGVDCGGSCSPCSPNTTYCTVTANPGDEYIVRVQLGSIDKTSDKEGKGYSDFTSQSTSLSKGSSNTITITPKWRGVIYNEGYSVWIDYNQDGDFEDSGEQVWSKGPSKDTSVKGDFTVPSSAKEGNTRMRVSIGYEKITSACGTIEYGEVEDYTVSIGGGSSSTCSDGIQNGDETGVDCGGSCSPCDTNSGNIVYVNNDDITVDASNTWNYFRIEVGGSNDFGAWHSSNSLRLVTYDKDIVCEENTSNITLIGEGEGIDSSDNFVANSSNHKVSSSSYTTWNGKTGFIGFTFKIDGKTHYGWFHVSVTSDGQSFTILDYAYNKKTNEVIYTRSESAKFGNNDRIMSSPNPFTSTFTINTSKMDKTAINLKVFDIQGKLLIEKKYAKNPNSITLGNQLKMSGIYFVRIQTNTEIETLRILKY